VQAGPLGRRTEKNIEISVFVSKMVPVNVSWRISMSRTNGRNCSQILCVLTIEIKND